jgi:hypothetical protein
VMFAHCSLLEPTWVWQMPSAPKLTSTEVPLLLLTSAQKTPSRTVSAGLVTAVHAWPESGQGGGRRCREGCYA